MVALLDHVVALAPLRRLLCPVLIVLSVPLVVSVHAPDFRQNPVRRLVPAARGGQVMLECRPRGAPKPALFWSRGTELLTNNSR